MRKVGSRALVVGAELVSWSAVLTLRESGCATVGMVSSYPRSEAYAAFRVPGRFLMDGPVLHPQPGRRHRGQGQGAPRGRREHRHRQAHDRRLRHRGVHRRLDPRPRTRPHRRPRDGCGDPRPRGRRGPAHQQPRGVRGRQPAASGRHRRRRSPGRPTRRGRGRPAGSRTTTRPPEAVRIRTDGPFRWVAPQLVSPDGGVAARGDLLFWVDEYRRLPKLRAVQDGRTLATKRTPWPAAPGRVYRAPWSLVADADPAGGDVTVSFA